MSRFLTFGIGGFHRALTARPQAMDMLEGNATNESTVPTAPVAPPPPPKQPASGVNVWRLLSVGLIAFLLATFTGRLQLPSVVSGVRDAVARAPSGVASSASANDPAAVAAVKDVTQQANDAPSTGTGTPGVVPGNPASSSSSSSNWSGYAASGGTFTSVTGTWTVPQVSSASAGADATWVGIGGMSSRDLIQAGTQATVTTNGGVRYEAWIEMLPQTSRTVALSVSAGDSVTVPNTAKSGNGWAIALKNN